MPEGRRVQISGKLPGRGAEQSEHHPGRSALGSLILAMTLALGWPTPATGHVARPSELLSFAQPRDEDGRFLNLEGPIERAGIDVTLPFFARRLGNLFRTPTGLPKTIVNDGTFLRENAGSGLPTLTWVGHASLLVQLDDQTFLTDPMWSKRASPVSFAGPARFQPPGLRIDDLPTIDFVLLSHNHYDHLDLPTLEAIARHSPDVRFLVPLGNGPLLETAGLRNIEELGWGDTTTAGGLTIHCLPNQHWSRRGIGDGNRALWASWAVIGPDDRFYFAGDTGYFGGFTPVGEALGPFDLAALPIGAYRPRAMMKPFHLDPAEAVQAGRDLDARRLIGIHYGTFDLADEEPSEPPRLFRAAGRVAGYAPQELLLPAIGETLILRGRVEAGPRPAPAVGSAVTSTSRDDPDVPSRKESATPPADEIGKQE